MLLTKFFCNLFWFTIVKGKPYDFDMQYFYAVSLMSLCIWFYISTFLLWLDVLYTIDWLFYFGRYSFFSWMFIIMIPSYIHYYKFINKYKLIIYNRKAKSSDFISLLIILSGLIALYSSVSYIKSVGYIREL
jgi:hypothetical protein